MCQKGPLGGALFWLVVSALTFLIGFGTPGWIVSDTQRVGLWQACNNATHACHDATDVIHGHWFEVTRVLAGVSLAFILLSLLITTIIICRASQPTPCIAFIAILCLATAGLVFGCVIQFAVEYSGELEEGELGYAFALCLLTGFMLLISFFLAGLHCCCPNRYNNPEYTPLLSREVV